MQTAVMNNNTSAAPSAAADKIERILQNSVPYKLLAILFGFRLQSYEFTPPALAKSIAEHTAEGAEMQKSLKEFRASVAEAVSIAVETDSDSDVTAAIDAYRFNNREFLQRMIRWFIGGRTLAHQHIEALKSNADSQAAEAEKVVDAVKADLTKIGSGLAEMWLDAHEYPDTAERQFDHFARHRNARSRSALAKAENAMAAYRAALEKQQQIPARLEAARKLLSETAIREITGSAV
jgi:hypothetical protein